MKGTLILTLCATDCHVNPPCFAEDCDITTRPSGIQFLIFFACDFSFDATVDAVPYGPIADYTVWETAIANGHIGLSPEGFGSKPQSTPQTERVSACLPEAIISETHTIAFTSKSMDNTNLTDATYWNNIKTNYKRYRLGYVGCDGYFYGKSTTEPGYVFTPSALGLIKEDNNDTVDRYEANLSFKHNGIVIPQEITNLLTAFNTDCPVS